MSLLNIDVGPLIQNWPLQAKADFANLLKNPFCTKDDWPVHNSVSKIHHLVQRSPTKKQEPPKMPVVFMPQKSETECERDSRMSSWGFMSFVLAAVNGVINISNNINNNNNNRNNNNNDNNNNE